MLNMFRTLIHPSNQINATHVITQHISRKLLRMDVLKSETCWALSKEIIKQVTSGWSLFTQLGKEKLPQLWRQWQYSNISGGGSSPLLNYVVIVMHTYESAFFKKCEDVYVAVTVNDTTDLSLCIGRLLQNINPTHRSVPTFIIGEFMWWLLCICGRCVVLCSAGAAYSCYMKCRKFRRELPFWHRKTFFTKKNGFQQQVPF